MKNSLFTFLLYISSSISIFGQNLPSLLIDNVSTQFSEVSLPYWLKAGQTINIGTNAQSVSILEFTVNGSNLEFSQTIALKTVQTVPASKVWKIEAIGLKSENSSIPSSTFISSGSSSSSSESLPTIFQSPKKFETVGTYNWKVPPGVTSICIEVWGAGGGGDRRSTSGGVVGGGGGGGYAYECFSVVPGTTYNVIVGSGGGSGSMFGYGGAGGTSSVGNLINVTGGAGGAGATGGAAGISTNSFNVAGGAGDNGSAGGAGGNGANGGAGGFAVYNTQGNPGVIPGGGGSGGNTTGGAGSASGGSGARGQVYIYW